MQTFACFPWLLEHRLLLGEESLTLVLKLSSMEF